MSVQPPLGTVTFLFTDIEDSTRLWESMPADMATAVQAHDVIVRSAIERHGGHVFASGGDGFCAAFSSAMDAVTAAVDSQRELGGDAAIPFAVRMALHTGEAARRDGNYSGTEVNRAARSDDPRQRWSGAGVRHGRGPDSQPGRTAAPG